MAEPTTFNFQVGDITEIVCDLVAFTATESMIKQNAFTATQFQKEYLPYLLTISAYNIVLRNNLMNRFQVPGLRSFTNSASTATEVLTLGSILWTVDMLIPGKNKSYLMHLMQTFFVKGGSEMLLRIKSELGIPVPT